MIIIIGFTFEFGVIQCSYQMPQTFKPLLFSDFFISFQQSVMVNVVIMGWWW